MDLHEDSVDTGGDGGAAEDGDELGLSAGLLTLAGKLDGVGRVENDRRVLAHDGKGAHIDDEIVIAEAGSALGEGDAIVAALAQL